MNLATGLMMGVSVPKYYELKNDLLARLNELVADWTVNVDEAGRWDMSGEVRIARKLATAYWSTTSSSERLDCAILTVLSAFMQLVEDKYNDFTLSYVYLCDYSSCSLSCISSCMVGKFGGVARLLVLSYL